MVWHCEVHLFREKADETTSSLKPQAEGLYRDCSESEPLAVQI
jgi:hypothetical protein